MPDPVTTDALIKQSVAHAVRRGKAQVAPIALRGGEYPLRFPDCDLAIDLSVPQGNAFNKLELSTGPQPPKSYARRAWEWSASFFTTPPPMPAVAPEPGAAYLQPFRATLAKAATGRVVNLTGYAWFDRFLHKHLKVECTGLNVDATGRMALEGSLRLGVCKLPLWSFFAPLHKLFRINMNMRDMLDQPIADDGTDPEADYLPTKRYLFGWLGNMVGDIHAEMEGTAPVEMGGMRYTPAKVQHAVRFTADGMQMTLATRGELEVGDSKYLVTGHSPFDVGLEPNTHAPMRVEIGPATLTLQDAEAKPTVRPGTFYNQGIPQWTVVVRYENNDEEYFDAPEPAEPAEDEEFFDALEHQEAAANQRVTA